MTDIVQATTTSSRLTTALTVAPEHLRLVLLAVRDHRVGMLFTTHGSGPFRIPSNAKRPAIVIIGDDMDTSAGPGGFHMPSIRRAIRACRSFAVISSEPTAEVYAAISAIAVSGRHAMIVETRVRHELEWAALTQQLAPRRPIILSTVKAGRA